MNSNTASRVSWWRTGTKGPMRESHLPSACGPAGAVSAVELIRLLFAGHAAISYLGASCGALYGTRLAIRPTNRPFARHLTINPVSGNASESDEVELLGILLAGSFAWCIPQGSLK